MMGSIQQDSNDTERQDDYHLNVKYKDRLRAEKQTQATLQRMQKDFVLSINAYALVLVLLTSVTFGGFLQPPGNFVTRGFELSSQEGATNDTGQYFVPRTEMTVFIVFNSLSFIFSVVDLLLCVISSLSPLRSIGSNFGTEESIPAIYDGELSLQSEQAKSKLLAHYVSSTLSKLIFVNVIFALSLTSCVVAFAAAGLVLVNKDFKDANFLAVLITTILGGALFAVFLVWLLISSFRYMKKVSSDESLSTSLQNRAASSQVQFRYLNTREKI